jgi:hypothetical protein
MEYRKLIKYTGRVDHHFACHYPSRVCSDRGCGKTDEVFPIILAGFLNQPHRDLIEELVGRSLTDIEDLVVAIALPGILYGKIVSRTVMIFDVPVRARLSVLLIWYVLLIPST